MSVRQGVNTIAGAVGKYPLNERNITNCITEIPQDIKLELSSGTLTLKAGSKVYVPNGVGVFDTITLTEDKTATQTTNDTRMYFYNGTYIEKFPIAQCFSGSSAPSGYQYMFWYDTTNNVVKKTSNSGSTWESGWSLPFCIATASGGALTSIDQVFNGFGYIDRTKFVLPGVKGLVPDGFNADGTLKNIEVTTSSVFSRTSSSTTSGVKCFFNSSAMENYPSARIVYDSSINKNIDSNDNSVLNMLPCSHLFEQTSGSVTGGVRFYNSFSALDYNDSEFIANCAMPSNKYINLTLGASGTSYTAPADGYLLLAMTNTNTFCEMRLNAGQLRAGSNYRYDATGYSFSLSIPVSKGNSVTAIYTNMSPQIFRFVYDQGAR